MTEGGAGGGRLVVLTCRALCSVVGRGYEVIIRSHLRPLPRTVYRCRHPWSSLVPHRWISWAVFIRFGNILFRY